MTEKKLNMLGEVCPIPLIRTQTELEKLKPNDTLVVETDMGQTVRNILRWCENQGYCFEVNESDDGIWFITITK